MPFNNYPYTNLNEINLDFILGKLRDLDFIPDEELKKQLIHTPEEFGAKCDGVTDDADAIQDMFDAVRAGVVVFRGDRTYQIGKSIRIHGGYASLTVLLGAVTYIGNSDAYTPMFDVVRDTSVFSNKAKYGQGGVKIYGGFLNCNYRAGIGLRNYDCFDTLFDGVKIFNYEHFGIANGSEDMLITDIHSTELKICNCVINNYENRPVYPNTGGAKGTAIFMGHQDNSVVNVIANQCARAVEIKAGGNYFTQCHFTITSEAPYSDPDSESIYDFIYNNPFNSGINATNIFDSCYFNGMRMKYLVNNEISNSLVTRIANCNLILGKINISETSYLMNSHYSMLQITGLSIRKSINTDVTPPAIQTVESAIYYASSMNFLGKSRISDIMYSNERLGTGFDITCMSNNPIRLIHSSTPLPADTMRPIARVGYLQSIPGTARIRVTTGSSVADLYICAYSLTSPPYCVMINPQGGFTQTSPTRHLKFYVKNSLGSYHHPDDPVLTHVVTYIDVYAYNDGSSDFTQSLIVERNDEGWPAVQVFVFNTSDGTEDISTPVLTDYTEIPKPSSSQLLT